LSRKEDHFIQATLLLGEGEIIGVPCKVYLPERINEKPKLVFKPTDDVMRVAGHAHKGALKAVVHRTDDSPDTVIESPEVYFTEASAKYWGDGLTESVFHGDPQDLRITKYFPPSTDEIKTKVVFWISPNNFLTPAIIRTSSYTGELEIKRCRSLEYRIRDGLVLNFDMHFDSKTDVNGDFVQWRFLVGCADLDTPADNVEAIKEDILPDIDDFLLISSFAARQRTACLGWTASDNKAHTAFYRGNYSFPEKNDESDNHYGVIDIRDMERFIEVCHSSLINYENKLAIRNAIYSAVPLKPEIITTSFLNTFSGLETLILDYRRTKRLEFVLANGEWKALSKQIRACIKGSGNPKLNPSQIDSICRKLPELNRISLREAFDLFCKEYCLELNDLWPVFKDSKGVGLSDIRNKLIHGDPYPEGLDGAIITALDHLKFVLERAIVRVLSWEIEDTLIGPRDMRRFRINFDDWHLDQKNISRYMQS